MTPRNLGTTGIAVSLVIVDCGNFGGIGGARHLIGRGLDRMAAFERREVIMRLRVPATSLWLVAITLLAATAALAPNPATQLVPPPVPGYDPARISTYRFDPAGARALLARFGYKESSNGGYRTMPDGRPLVLTMSTTPDSASRQYDELWKRNLDAIGIRITFVTQKWSELNKMALAGKLQMWSLGISTPTPDADLFYTMLYSGSIGEFNYARFSLPDCDRAYEASGRLPDGPARFALFREMDALLEGYAPMILNAFRYQNLLVQPWLKGFKENIFAKDNWAYYATERP